MVGMISKIGFRLLGVKTIVVNSIQVPFRSGHLVEHSSVPINFGVPFRKRRMKNEKPKRIPKLEKKGRMLK